MVDEGKYCRQRKLLPGEVQRLKDSSYSVSSLHDSPGISWGVVGVGVGVVVRETLLVRIRG